MREGGDRRRTTIKGGKGGKRNMSSLRDTLKNGVGVIQRRKKK